MIPHLYYPHLPWSMTGCECDLMYLKVCLLCFAEKWGKLVAKLSVVPQQPSRWRDWWWWWWWTSAVFLLWCNPGLQSLHVVVLFTIFFSHLCCCYCVAGRYSFYCHQGCAEDILQTESVSPAGQPCHSWLWGGSNPSLQYLQFLSGFSVMSFSLVLSI